MKKLTHFAIIAFFLFSLPLFAKYTSVTDSTGFPQYCHYAAQNNNEFLSFRKSTQCLDVVDTVNKYQGIAYLKYLHADYPHLLNDLNHYIENDNVGNPIKHSFGKYGKICPTSLRYLKILGDLEKLFSPKEPIKIIEIGGGYGGQCRILFQSLPIAEYIIIDLPEVLELIQRYLEKNNIYNVTYMPPNEIPDSLSCDLLISNYAFSECEKEIQTTYINKVLKNAKHGYMLCNYLSPDYRNFFCFAKNEIMKEMQKLNLNPIILPEAPLTNKNNYLLIW